jgi:hypothetical protein
MNERESVINFLFQACDAKNRTIEQLQAQLAALQKPTPEVTVEEAKKRTVKPAATAAEVAAKTN